MKLYSSLASPFSRKARIIIRELDLARLVEEINVNPAASEELRRINPLGKIPVLVLKDGTTIIDSPVICEYLDDLGGGQFFPPFEPRRDISARWRALTLQALGDGICDATVARVYEGRRPPEQQSEQTVHKHLAAVNRSLDVLERAPFTEPFTIGEIAVACALGYLDFRLPELSWRDARPNLRDWYEKFAQYPSMKDTRPANPA
ncbi:MAG TPA: glutathione S-transferase family protein [Rhizomicrobium sp.]|nr:glutathione S-transferase family protein [Rhizomicrobium sp.]